MVPAWTNDPAHPVSTGEELSRLLPDSEFHVADSVDDLHRWGPPPDSSPAAAGLSSKETPCVAGF
jgi:hypothetical protein